MPDKEPKPFPLKTVLVIMKVYDLVNRGVRDTGVTEDDGMALVRHMCPNAEMPPPVQQGSYLRDRFRPVLAKHFPRLAALRVDRVTQSNYQGWIKAMELEYDGVLEIPVTDDVP